MPGILKAQMFHACMYAVLEPLRNVHVKTIVDPTGAKRRCTAVLMAWIADLEEQYLIAALSKNNCPTCEAGYHDLGHNCPKNPRTGDSILKTLRELRELYPEHNTWEFVKEAKKYGLSGVERPCWEGLPGDICRIISVDLLHGVHKMFVDHVVPWISATTGEEELDLRLMAQPHRVGNRNFGGGISKISQWSGRENRDLERHILAAIAGDENLTPRMMRAIRALLDFIYKAQFPVHNDKSLNSMQSDLKVFWDNANAFLDNGARLQQHFNIPKLHNLHHYLKNIQHLGSADNYSTEIGETLHMSMCKAAYRSTNRKSYSEQIIRYLRRQESIHIYKAYLAWRTNTYPNNDDDEDEEDDTNLDTINRGSNPGDFIPANQAPLRRTSERAISSIEVSSCVCSSSIQTRNLPCAPC